MTISTATIDRILNHLNTGKTLTAKSGATKFGVYPHTVRARISELRGYGYGVTATPRHYRGRTIAVYSLRSY